MLKPNRPRHAQIAEWLRERIEAGDYAVDEQLPSENELCDRFDVSRVTVRRALQTLEGEGYIYRRQGLGSFVAEPNIDQGLVRLTDFNQDMAEAGLEAHSEVVFHGIVDAPPRVAYQLTAEPASSLATRDRVHTDALRVVQLDRRRLASGQPVAFDRTWLPPLYGQLLEGHDLTGRTIYSILETEYDIPVLSGRYRIEAVCADETLAEHLDMQPQRPLLLIKRLSRTTAGRAIYYQERFYRTDRVAYELELARHPDQRVSSAEGHALRTLMPVFTSGEDR